MIDQIEQVSQFWEKKLTIITLRQAIKSNWNDFDYDEPITTIL